METAPVLFRNNVELDRHGRVAHVAVSAPASKKHATKLSPPLSDTGWLAYVLAAQTSPMFVTPESFMNILSFPEPREMPAPRSPDEDPTPLRRGANGFFAASIFAQVSALVRYVVLARLLGPEQLGLAATLVVTSAFFDMVSDTGGDRFLIQDREGDTISAQKLVHLVYVGRGLLISAGLVIFAIPIADFYKNPRLAPGLAFLALVPFVLSFLHLDIRRVQRRLDFRSEAINQVAAEGASLVATLLAAYLTRDFTAVLYGMIARALVTVLVSHLRAERPYAIGYAAAHGPRLLRFAAPLMLSGLMLFIGSQGDRVVVAKQLGVKELGQYSAILLLIYYPSSMLLRYVHVMYMPLIAAARDDKIQRDKVSDALGGQTLLLALAMAAGFAVLAPPMVTILYGARFTQPALIIGMIGILQTTRFLIVWPTTIALSMGRTRTVLASNFVRLFAFPGAYIGGWVLGNLSGVVAGFIGGELISIATALVLVNRSNGRSLLHGLDRFALFVLTAALIVGWNIDTQWASFGGAGALDVASAVLVAVILRRESTAIGEMIALAKRIATPMLPFRSP